MFSQADGLVIRRPARPRRHMALFWPFGLTGRAVEPVGIAVHLARIEVAVQVEGCGDAGMTHDLLQHLGW